MKTKICTSIEQSKKLLSLGLDPNTADMFYNLGESQIPNAIYGSNDDFKCYILAWSLTALLELMPIGSHIEKKNSGYACYVVYTKPLEASTPIEAAFEMVCLLIEKEYIKVNK